MTASDIIFLFNCTLGIFKRFNKHPELCFLRALLRLFFFVFGSSEKAVIGAIIISLLRIFCIFSIFGWCHSKLFFELANEAGNVVISGKFGNDGDGRFGAVKIVLRSIHSEFYDVSCDGCIEKFLIKMLNSRTAERDGGSDIVDVPNQKHK